MREKILATPPNAKEYNEFQQEKLKLQQKLIVQEKGKHDHLAGFTATIAEANQALAHDLMLQCEACSSEKKRQEKILKNLRIEKSESEAKLEQMSTQRNQLEARAAQLRAELESVLAQTAEVE